jgi:hypothetical protein
LKVESWLTQEDVVGDAMTALVEKPHFQPNFINRTTSVAKGFSYSNLITSFSVETNKKMR